MIFLPSEMNIFLVAITNVDCRPGGGRSKITRVRVSNLIKNKIHSKSIHRQSSFLQKSNTHILIRGATGGGTSLLFGTLALRSYVSNNYKGSIESSRILINGTGSVCVNRENFSNFIFNEFRCPLSPIFALNNRYCCGPFQQQYCCSFWESGGRAIGAIIGIISACSIFILFIFYCIVYIRRSLRRKESPSVKSYLNHPFQTQLYSDVNYISSDFLPTFSEVVGCFITKNIDIA
ncbi:unnamed protein product [Rotaria sordida]|uniref:Shisa N-terminal domain-containing protein n=1 Tax=Rotaria sordida TaxID=392033 RepID=A0A814E520_9BILA|nr:unnamed protein product [Rotaria sordida]